MKQLIINADDFGYSRAINYGIIDAHTEGVLTSTTLMTNMPGAQHAYELGRNHPDLGIGVHLTLTCGKPICSTHHTLVDMDGNFKKLHHYQKRFHIDQEELYSEWKAQIESFIASGLTPTHLDSHHHIHHKETMQPIFVELAKEYNLPVRNYLQHNDTTKALRTTEAFEMNPEVLLKDIDELLAMYRHATTIEIMCHPAYLDKQILEQSSYAMPRIEELTALIHPSMKAKFRNSSHVQLISYRDLRRGALS
ncbi:MULTISPECIES: chitin disaccharide deacetylase [Virgibacillus]|uniref:Carbohydrate deacetylase n=2 Tax=Virgibacillus TaxID=84406 RepID=A0A024Q818_9BACI|nr:MULTISPECIES: chitin disaccharide deacetylase [Virgibacillus]EQB37787.1 hypothetical protein M948_04290 [Virgibacillus sp. CM-4]MYL40521.1 chitin disaccharide deacetylase [Virgibacillus massiliensis]GGJ58222.1 carbohydrate deacetylase [Virgibacillus kapii]CDQ38688.1 hopanoid biosynthesis associated protein HpnK [Virgibacillus massiliensis]